MQVGAGGFLRDRAGAGALPEWLRELAARPENAGALAHWETLPSRTARFGELQPPLPAPVQGALESRGITRLYTHQVCAIEALRAGRDTVVVTGTASGKSLCFHLPVLERLLEEPDATALYLFPTKALAQDQLKSLTRLAQSGFGLAHEVRAGVYDGDTAASTRRKLRDEANVILSNPDMLHAGILPQHARWARFLRSLRYVVIDEMHAYRGIFGSHVANVLRRLERLVRHYGGDFRYVLCSATIRNPGELAHALTGREVAVVDDDGAPRGPRHFVFWNPPYRDEARVERRSSNVEGCGLMSGLMQRGAQVITFTKSRVSAELVYRYTREHLERGGRGLDRLHERLRPYRGGYLPEERRAIEKALFSGELRGVVSTNALELGIDVGGLDAAVLIGAAPTFASIWQQAGRAGRSGAPSVVVLVAYNDTVDQYLMRRPEWFFGRAAEAACVDPHNPYILAQQLACAAYELPLEPTDAEAFGPQTTEVLAALERHDLASASASGTLAALGGAPGAPGLLTVAAHLHLALHQPAAAWDLVERLPLPPDDPEPLIAMGRAAGQITRERRGQNGFGFDPIFIKNDYDKTFAELDEITKNRISHRRKALEKLLPVLESLR